MRNLIRRDYPQFTITSFALLGEGEDHIAFAVNSGWIFRFAKDEEAARQATRDEAKLLTLLQSISPLPIPAPRYLSEEHGYIGYKKLVGVPLLRARGQFNLREWPKLPQVIGAFLTALHAVPRERVENYVGEDRSSLEDWREGARASFAAVESIIPTERIDDIEAFLRASVPTGGYTLTFAHNDLGIEHVLVDLAARRITGIIDWGDAAIADPACDFGRLYRDLGRTTLDATLENYRSDTNEIGALRARAMFYGRCSLFEEMEYGSRVGQEAYLQKSLAALEWLFD